MAKREERQYERGNAAQKKHAMIIGAVVLAVVLTAVLILCLFVRKAVNKQATDIIWNNIYIDAINVSGMDRKEAQAALVSLVSEYKHQSVKLIIEHTEAEVSLESLGFEAEEIDQLIDEAVSYGKKGSIWSRYKKLKALKEKAVRFEMSYAINEEITKQVILDQFAKIERLAVNATIKRENGQFVITEEQSGIKVDMDLSVQKVKDYFQKEWKCQSAHAIDLLTQVHEPNVTKEDLQQIKDVLGSFSTSFQANNNRGKNIVLATSRINGIVVLPGEEMSTSEAMGSRNAANGYLEAGSYLNGETVDSYGGGVCQVSTTLYNAAIFAELEITERSSHSMVVDYVKPSMDAAIAEGVLDLKIKNHTQAPIYIEGLADGGKLTFTIYGKEYRVAGRKVTYISETTGITDPGKKFVATNAAIGTFKKAVSGHQGMQAILWKVVTENGVEVSREQINKSSYMASPATYHVGIGTEHAQAAAIVNNAIKTQDETAIRNAIAQAQAMIATIETP